MKFFEYKNLPDSLKKISKSICELAMEMDNILPDCEQKTAGLQKLLEAKDCLVRANL